MLVRSNPQQLSPLQLPQESRCCWFPLSYMCCPSSSDTGRELLNSLLAAAPSHCHSHSLALGSTWAGLCAHMESHRLPSLPKVCLFAANWFYTVYCSVWNITIEYCRVVQLTCYFAIGATIKEKRRLAWHFSCVSFTQSRVFCKQLLENLNCLAHTSVTNRCWFLLKMTKHFAPLIFCRDFYPIPPCI